MQFTVGGEEFDLTPARIILAMRGATSEPIQKHVVEIEGRVFPPKQVFATVTGRTRTSFTTMEAQRVLRRLGFVCRPATPLGHPLPAGVAAAEEGGGEGTLEARVVALEATIGTLQAAVSGLHTRVTDLERAR
ncbi:MAG: hypothetical protein ACRD2W_12035 [Acidimicrobiales bacterium]